LELALAITTLALIPFGPRRCTSLGSHTARRRQCRPVRFAIPFRDTSIGVYGVALAGMVFFSSEKPSYSLLGGLRSYAQNDQL